MELDSLHGRDRALGAEPTPRPLRPTSPSGSTGIAAITAIAEEADLRRIRILAWRDLDDPEAGGSELHAHRIAALWSSAGIDVSVRTSAVAGQAERLVRDGYEAVRRSGRYGVFPSSAWEVIRRPRQPGEGLVEIWNGMPFLSPLWYRGPRITFLHHVHAEMWQMALPGSLARMGDLLERRIAPPFYRGSRVVTPSESSRSEIIDMLHLGPDWVTVAPPGVDPRFTPGGERSPEPLVVAVGRLVTVKRFDRLIEALVRVRQEIPGLRAVIAGEGYARPDLEALIRRADATEWIALPGHIDDDHLIGLYRSAWVVASTSVREGWGMTLTEAAACGTPAVATDIAGHRDAVIDGQTGLLAPGPDGVAAGLIRVLGDGALRDRLSQGAYARASQLTWESTARVVLAALAEAAVANQHKSRRHG